jgi:hypothetical protein
MTSDLDCGHDAQELFYHGCSGSLSGQAGVHALIIGIGVYDRPRRPGGRKFDSLPGAVAAATRFAEYLRDDFHDPFGRHVKTVRLLLSPDQGSPKRRERLAKFTWTEAEYAATILAIEDWMSDCDDNPANVALMYMASHGVVTPSGARTAFLRQAGLAKNPYAFALNLSSLKRAMLRRRAETNFYIWDFCALAADDVPPVTDGTGFSPTVSGGGEVHPGRENEVVISPRVGTQSYSLSGLEGTLLSWALLGRNAEELPKYLFYKAAEVDEEGIYGVTPGRLKESLLPTMRDIRNALQHDEKPIVDAESCWKLPITTPMPILRVEISGVSQDEMLPLPGGGFVADLPAGKYDWDRIVEKADHDKTSTFTVYVDRDLEVDVTSGKVKPP